MTPIFNLHQSTQLQSRVNSGIRKLSCPEHQETGKEFILPCLFYFIYFLTLHTGFVISHLCEAPAPPSGIPIMRMYTTDKLYMHSYLIYVVLIASSYNSSSACLRVNGPQPLVRPAIQVDTASPMSRTTSWEAWRLFWKKIWAIANTRWKPPANVSWECFETEVSICTLHFPAIIV